MTEVFEHIIDPTEGLKSIKTFLKPNGALYISIIGLLSPTWRDIKKFTLVPHPYNFSLQTLTMVIEAHGFKLVAGNEGIQAMFVSTDDPPMNYVARRENYEAIREKFVTLEEKKRKASYRYKEKLKAWIRELLKSVGLFDMVLALREKISGPKIQ